MGIANLDCMYYVSSIATSPWVNVFFFFLSLDPFSSYSSSITKVGVLLV